MVDAIDVLCIGLVLFTDASAGPASAGNPGKAQGSPRKVSVKNSDLASQWIETKSEDI